MPNVKQQQEDFQHSLTLNLANNKKTPEYYQKLTNPPSVAAKTIQKFKQSYCINNYDEINE